MADRAHPVRHERRHLGADVGRECRFAFIGEPPDDIREWGFAAFNPEAALAYLHYHRAAKTPYELACMREASARSSARLSRRSRTWMAEGTAKGLRTAPIPAISAMLGRSPLPTMARAVNSPPAQVQVLAGHQTCLLMAVAHVRRLRVAV